MRTTKVFSFKEMNLEKLTEEINNKLKKENEVNTNFTVEIKSVSHNVIVKAEIPIFSALAVFEYISEN